MQMRRITRRDGCAAAAVCPFATRGVDDPAMRACPGFAATTLSFRGIGAGDSIAPRDTCGHLGVQGGRRGFVTACGHPAGRPPAAEELASRMPRAWLLAAGS